MSELTPMERSIQRILRRGLRSAVSEHEAGAVLSDPSESRRARIEASGIAERLEGDGAALVASGRLLRTQSLDAVRLWDSLPHPALVLLGTTGLGKTMAAAWMIAKRGGRYVRADDLCNLKHRVRRGHPGAEGRYMGLLRTELLVLDELGAERDQGSAAEMLQDVIDLRQRTTRRTLLMGNLTRGELRERYDKRTLDRIGVGEHDGIGMIVEVEGESLRRRRREAVR